MIDGLMCRCACTDGLQRTDCNGLQGSLFNGWVRQVLQGYPSLGRAREGRVRRDRRGRLPGVRGACGVAGVRGLGRSALPGRAGGGRRASGGVGCGGGRAAGGVGGCKARREGRQLG